MEINSCFNCDFLNLLLMMKNAFGFKVQIYIKLIWILIKKLSRTFNFHLANIITLADYRIKNILFKIVAHLIVIQLI